MAIISFDRAVDYYDATRGFMPGVPEQIRDAILAYTGASAATRFMELGIGTGRIAMPFIEAGYEFDGLDISIPMMAKLQQKLDELPARFSKPRSAFHCGLAQVDLSQPIPIASGSYDVVIAIHIFHLLQNWQDVLRESRRILGSKGWILISAQGWEKGPAPEPQAYSPSGEVSKHWNAILEGLGYKRERARPVNRRPDEELSAYLERLGAKTEVVTLLEFLHPPLSARQFADRLKGRMYSSEWYIPEDVFAQACQRLDQWLDSECPTPDTPTQEPDAFCVLAASWD